MKKSLLFVVGFLIAISCNKKPELPKIAGWERYHDPYIKISFVHPTGWHAVQEGSRINLYSSADVATRFSPYSAEGPDGARLIVEIKKMDTLKVLDKYVSDLRTDLSSSGFDVTVPESKNLAELPGTLLRYSGALDAKNKIAGIQLTAIRDSSMFTVKYEGFNDAYAGYMAVLDSALASMKLPAVKVAAKAEDPSIPAADFIPFDSKYLKLSHPANFETTFPQPKAPVEYSVDVKGYRQDSYIRIDVLPAKGLKPEKVVEQNAKFFKETSRGEATIDGIMTTFLNYAPAKEVQGRAYFLVKNDKTYRIIMMYPTNMRSVYLPAFEKVVGSLLVK